MPTEFIVSVPRNRLGIAVTGGLPRLLQRFFFLHTLLFLIKKNNAKIYNKTKDTVLLNDNYRYSSVHRLHQTENKKLGVRI